MNDISLTLLIQEHKDRIVQLKYNLTLLVVGDSLTIIMMILSHRSGWLQQKDLLA